MRAYFMEGPWVGETREIREPLPPIIVAPWAAAPTTYSCDVSPTTVNVDIFYYELHRVDSFYIYTPRGWTASDIIQRLLSWYVR
jgi:hypothetical protein